MTKTQRQHRIGELIERERISTAAQLVTRLQSEGISATQATGVSWRSRASASKGTPRT